MSSPRYPIRCGFIDPQGIVKKLTVCSHCRESKQELNHDYEIVLLSILPWFHVYGLMTMIHVTCAGVRLIMLPKFEEDSFLHSIEKYKPTSSFMVPPLMVFLAKHPLVDKYDMTSLRELYCGAAPLSQEVEMAVLKRLPHIEVNMVEKLSSETLILALLHLVRSSGLRHVRDNVGSDNEPREDH